MLMLTMLASAVAAHTIVDPQVSIGAPMTLTVDRGIPDARYWLDVGASVTSPGVAASSGRALPLDRPWVHSESKTPLALLVSSGFAGFTNAWDRATAATIDLPAHPAIVGLQSHAGFVTEDPTSSDGIGIISQPLPFEPGSSITPTLWNVAWPDDIPLAYRPSLPWAPRGSKVVTLAGGRQSVSGSDTEYRLSGDVDQITIAPGTTRIVIDGRGFKASRISLPSVWPIPGSPSVSDVVIRNIMLTGGPNGTAIDGACRRLLLQSVSTLRNSVPKYCLYTRFSEDVVLEDCRFHTLGEEACVRLVDVQRVAAFRCTFDSDVKHAFRVHFSSSYVWLSDSSCSKPLYIGYVEDRQMGRPPTNLRNIKLRRVHVSPQPGGNVMQITHPSRLTNFEMSDCTFHADGPLTQNQVSSFMATADATPHWSYRDIVVR